MIMMYMMIRIPFVACERMYVRNESFAVSERENGGEDEGGGGGVVVTEQQRRAFLACCAWSRSLRAYRRDAFTRTRTVALPWSRVFKADIPKLNSSNWGHLCLERQVN